MSRLTIAPLIGSRRDRRSGLSSRRDTGDRPQAIPGWSYAPTKRQPTKEPTDGSYQARRGRRCTVSGRCTGWVLRHGPRDRGLRLVLVAIADAANSEGEHAHPTREQIAEASLYSRAAVTRALRRLVDDGWLVIESEGGGRGKATVYRVPMEETGSPRAGLADGNGLIEHPETGSSESNTGSSPRLDRSPTVLSTERLSTVAAAPPRAGWSAQAHELTCRWWEARVADTGTAPGQPFVAAAKVVHELLHKGWHPDLVARGLAEVPTVSGAAFDLWRRRQTNGNAEREARSFDVVRERVARRGR